MNQRKVCGFVVSVSYNDLIVCDISLICDNSVTTCDLSGETFKGFEVLYFSMSVTTTQLLSSGKFCKLRYDTIPVKSASENISFYTNNSQMPNFE
jgi:hypothetical protein